MELFTDRCVSEIEGSIDSDDTTINVPTGHGSRFASPIGGDYQYIYLLASNTAGATYEICKVTARSSDALTVVRNQGGTNQSWSDGTLIIGGPTAASMVALASGGDGGLVLLDTKEASNSATLDFTTAIDDTYDVYVLRVGAIVPATDNASLYLLFSTDGGSNWLATNYRWINWRDREQGGGAQRDIGHLVAQVQLGAYGLGNNTGENGNAVIELHSLRTSLYKLVEFKTTLFDQNGDAAYAWGIGGNPTTSPVNALRLKFSAGNITSGWARLYGVRKTLSEGSAINPATPYENVFEITGTDGVTTGSGVSAEIDPGVFELSFTLAESRRVEFQFKVRASLSANYRRVQLRDDTTVLGPVDISGYRGWYTQYVAESSFHECEATWVATLAAGTHRINLHTVEAVGTSSATWYDRVLLARVLSPTAGTVGSRDISWLTQSHDAPPSTAGTHNDEGNGLTTATWAWRNQEGASITTDAHALVLTAPTSAGNDLRIYEQSVSGNFDVECRCYLVPGLMSGTALFAGLAMVNSGSGKVMIVAAYTATSNSYLLVQKYTDVNTWSSNPTLITVYPDIVLSGTYFRMTYNGTNVTFYMSGVGTRWTQLFTETAATFLGTPDKIGLVVNNYDGGADCAGVFEFFRDVV